MPNEKKKPARVWPVLRSYSKAALAYPGLLSAVIASVIVIEAGSVIAPLFLKRFINVLAAGTSAPGSSTP